jgi:CheY-like chemotaxis protein
MDSQWPSDVFNEFREELNRALSHLYAPAYQPSKLLEMVLGKEEAHSVAALRRTIVEAIEALKPPANVSHATPIWRMYEVLSCRYVQTLTHKETAAHLGISQRHLSREQAKAVDWLAQRLWEQRQSNRSTSHSSASVPVEAVETLAKEQTEEAFRKQLRQELVALHQSMPDAIVDVAEVIQSIAQLWPALTADCAVRLSLQPITPGLLASVHPIVLRQLLITAVKKLTEQLKAGEITATASKTDNQVVIKLVGGPATGAFVTPRSEFLQGMLDMLNGSLAVHHTEDYISFVLKLPYAEQIKVLVVDDNADLVHFYRRYVEGTRYDIVNVQEGLRIWEAVATHTPDIIVLDVMLPDIDGWQLLVDLHQHPSTSHKPIIICSVVRHEKLALALGATLFVAKPVRRQEFIAALERASAAKS